MFENAINIQGRSQKSFTAGTAYSEKLEPGVYDVWAEADVYLKVSQTDTTPPTDETGYLLRENNTVPVQITSPSYISAAGDGTVYFHQVG